MKVALQRSLAMIIRKMRGIESAFVLYDTEVTSRFRREKVTTAMASVKAEGNAELDDDQVSAIRHLVAGAIASLKAENVTVTDLNGSTYHGGDPENGGSAHDNLYVSLKRIHEQEWKTKILNALSYVPGVKVTPNVTLADNRLERTSSQKHDPKALALKVSSEDSEMTRDGGAPGGRPGLVAQGAMVNQSATVTGPSSGGSSETKTESKSESLSVPNTTVTEEVKEPLIPKEVKVAVSVPSSYLEKVWAGQNPTEEGQEPQKPDQNALTQIGDEVTTKIKATVGNLLPEPEDPNVSVTDLVTVEVFQDIVSPEIPGPSMAENTMAWFGQYWSTLGMVGLALFSLMMLRSMVRSVAPAVEPATPDGAPTTPGAAAEAETAEEAVLSRLGTFSGSGKSLRDELTDLVQEDTDAAANILRTWIGTVD